MPSLLIEVLVIDKKCPPFLSILIPSSVAIAALFFSLDLDPLEHLNSSVESHTLVDLDGEVIVSHRPVRVTFARAVKKFEVVLPVWLVCHSLGAIFFSSGQNIMDSRLFSLIKPDHGYHKEHKNRSTNYQ